MSLRERLRALVGHEHVGERRTGAEPAIPLVTPPTEEALVQVVELAAKDGLTVLPLGADSRRGEWRPSRPPEVALSTRALSGVACYEPGDGTVAARAGTTMAELAGVVREGGHRLTPDVARPETTTLGGVVATATSGIDRLRFGPLRNHVLGVRAVLADGSLTKSGGRLVKNVTGYDLHRLYTGSRGSLCVLVEVALRLFPLPEGTRLVHARGLELEEAVAKLLAARDLALPFDLLAAARCADGSFATWAAVSGRSAALDAHLPALERVLPGEVTDGDGALVGVRELRDADPVPDAMTLRIETVPSAIGAVARALLDALDELGASAPRLAVQPAVASLELQTPRDEDVAHELTGVVRRLADEQRERRRGVHARWSDVPDEVPLAITTPPVGAMALAQELRASLDPGGRFAGELPGGSA